MARAVGLSAAIEAMPMGMQTLIVASAFPDSLMQQLLIARCFAQKPDLIILDETLTRLDADVVEAIIAAARSTGTMIVFSTHRQDLLRLADRISRIGIENQA